MIRKMVGATAQLEFKARTSHMKSIRNDDFVINQSLPGSAGRRGRPLTVRAIINHISRRKAKLTDKERAFLADFSSAEDRASFIEDGFFASAMEGGETVRQDDYQLGSEPGGWFGISRFYGLYVIHFIQYGEGQEDYGPFAERKEADLVFDAVVASNTPG
jgi:hypothetical protein